MSWVAKRTVSLIACLWGNHLVACSNASTTPDSGTNPPSDGAADTWEQVIGDGFGISGQDTVPEFEVYNGYLYATTAPTGTGMLAKIYRSESGNADSWTEVTPTLMGDRSIHALGKTAEGGGVLWCGTGSGAGATIFRTQDGTNWTQIAERGFGNTPLLTGVSPHFVVFQGPTDSEPYLYAAMGTHGAGVPGQVWRTPYTNSDPDNWAKLADFSDADGDQYSKPAVDTISYFYVWNDTLYFSTNASAQLWQSVDGTTFTQNSGVGNGFGVATNVVIASLEVFNDALYATTNNPTLGGQVWRTSDGASWEMITGDAFGKGNRVFELRSIRASFEKLWITGYTDTAISAGTPVWRSDDGDTWVQSNIDGFGDPNNNGQNAVTIGFGDYQYWGGPNYVDGGQIWRARIR